MYGTACGGRKRMMQDLVKAITDTVTSMLNEVHTALPAEIVEFDPKDCTATVLPLAKMVLTNGKVIDYPQITDVPVMFQQGAGRDVSVVFPVKKGDGCLLIVSEQTLDMWRGEGEQFSEMKYALSNAVALPGLFSKPPKEIKDAIEDDCIIVTNKNLKMVISEKHIGIDGDVKIRGDVKVSGSVSEHQLLLNPFNS